MEDLNIKQLALALRTIADEKNLPEETVLGVIEQAIAAAWRRDNGERDQNVRAELNLNDGTAKVFVIREIVEEVNFPSTEVSLEEARATNPDAELGGTVEEVHNVTSFGRVAAQTAKQVVLQRLREAEREVVLAEFEDKIGTVVTGIVQRVEPRIVRVEIDREHKHAKVYVTEDQQSIAIGRSGQNVRLASRLTGFELDIETAASQPAERKPRKNIEDDLFSAIENQA